MAFKNPYQLNSVQNPTCTMSDLGQKLNELLSILLLFVASFYRIGEKNPSQAHMLDTN